MSSERRDTVADGDEFDELIRRGVDPGTEIVLADGTYEDAEVEIVEEVLDTPPLYTLEDLPTRP